MRRSTPLNPEVIGSILQSHRYDSYFNLGVTLVCDVQSIFNFSNNNTWFFFLYTKELFLSVQFWDTSDRKSGWKKIYWYTLYLNR